MAPAGSFESLRAAIDGGADSVYFGVGSLNMRSKSAGNFTIQDLTEVATLCRKYQVKSYLALNVVIYDEEIEEVCRLVDAAVAAGIDALIVSDQSVIEYASDKKISLHLSTQLNISNIQSVKFYARYADVMVLARELTLDQITSIAQKIREDELKGPSGNLIRLELFVHGALCMAISGKCYLSLHQYNSSANRGACFQGCRRSYIVQDKDTGDELEIDNEYIMSPKDLCTIGFIDKILAAGISVLKIEGRARPPEYVKRVTTCYLEAVEAVDSGTFSKQRIDQWMVRLSEVFNRGFWDGYYLGQTMGEWSDRYGSKATFRRVYVGKGIKYFSKLSVGEFLMETQVLCVGDQVMVTGPTTGLIEWRIEELWLEDQPVDRVQKGDRFSMKVPEKIRPSDKLFRWDENQATSE